MAVTPINAVLILSTGARLLAALLALRLLRFRGKPISWLLLSGALVVWGAQGAVVLSRVFFRPEQFLLDLPAELMTLCASVLVLFGVAGIRPFLLAERRRGRLYRGIVETSFEGILVMNKEGAISFVNQRLVDMLDFSRKEMLGQHLFGFISPDTREAARGILDSREQGRPKTVDLCFRRKLSGVVCVLASHSSLYDGGQYLGSLIMVTDINERKRMEDSLRRSEQSLRATLDALAQRVAILNHRGRILNVNRCWREDGCSGPVPEQPVEGDNYLALMAGQGEAEEKAAAFAAGIRGVLAGKLSEFELEYSLKTGDGQRWYRGRLNPFTSNGLRHIVVSHDDITSLKLAESAIKDLAYHDALTGLPNRLLLRDRLEHHLIQAGREGEKVALLFLDLDHFKVINDTLGHSAGDLMLQTVATRLLAAVRKSDTVSRLGGDEFVILLTGLESPAAATTIVRKILQMLTLPVELEGRQIFTSTSIGIALFPEDGTDSEVLLGRADMAMYLAKEEGRNTYRFFSRKLDAGAQDRLATENALRQALAADELLLQFQDQAATAGGALRGVAARLFWRHPEQGLLAEPAFAALAEESGLAPALGLWTLRAACSRGRCWLDQGYPPLQLAVPLTLHQALDPALPEQLATVLDETGFPAPRLELEVPEIALKQNPAQAIALVDALHRQGIRLTITDFASSAASLALLHRLPVSRLKVGSALLTDVLTADRDSALLRTLGDIARNFSLQLVVEGVDDEEQRRLLATQGCDEIQGYHFPRPVPEEQWLGLLQQIGPNERGAKRKAPRARPDGEPEPLA